MRTLVFDLDGTLADTAMDLIAAANKVFTDQGYGHVLDPENDAQVAMQGGGRAMLKYGFDALGITKTDAQIEELYPLIIDAYAEGLCVHSTLYPGCKNALTRMADAGYPLAVCTNKPGKLAVPLLGELGIDQFFETVIAADTLAVRKPHPEPMITAVSRAGGDLKQSVLFGDSVTDRETARAAGCASVLVTFGPIGQAVLDLQPDALMHHYDDIEAVLNDLSMKAQS